MEQQGGDDCARDDVAQVVLRSLLAWPLVGVTAALAVGALQQSSSHVLRLSAFGCGAGLGGGVVFAVADLVARARWRRPPPLIVALGLLFSLAPALLLGAEFATRLAWEGSSAEATRALVEAHSARPGALFDLDAALATLLVAGPLLVARARPVQAQATIAAWVVLLGAVAGLAAGRLQLPLAVVVTGELVVATFAPFALLGADRIVTALRRAVTGSSDVAGAAASELRRAVALLALLVVPPATAAVCCAADRRAVARLTTYLGPLLIVLALVVVLWLARRRLARAGPLLAAATLGGAFPVLIFGPAEGGPIAAAVVALALVVHSIVLTLDATGLRAVLAQARPTSVWPVLTALVLAATVLGLALAPRRTGPFLRAQLRLLLGEEPIGLLRRVEASGPPRAASDDPWMEALRSTGAQLEGSSNGRDLAELRLRAAAAGDAAAAASVIQDGLVPLEQALAWLRRDVAGGHLEALDLLLPRTPDDEERARLGRRLVEAAQRGEGTGASLLEVWERCPERRPEVERLLAEDAERWTYGVSVHDGSPRPFREAVGRANRQAVARAGFVARQFSTPAHRRLYNQLRYQPDLVRAGDALLCARTLLTWPRARLDPLAGVDLGPLSPAPWDTSEALATTWSRTTKALRADPRDPSALRARAHALLFEVRVGIYEAFGPWRGARMTSEAGLELALGQLEAVPPAVRLDAGWTFDLALVEAHRALLLGRLDGARLHALLDAALCLAPADPLVQGRVDALRAVVVGGFGPPAPERLAAERAAYVATLRDLPHQPGLEPDQASALESRAEAAAAALERLR